MKKLDSKTITILLLIGLLLVSNFISYTYITAYRSSKPITVRDSVVIRYETVRDSLDKEIDTIFVKLKDNSHGKEIEAALLDSDSVSIVQTFIQLCTKRESR